MKQRQKIYLRQWRKHRGLTVEQLAERLHMHKGNLSKIERGKLPYSQDLLEAVAEILACEPADIIVRDPTDPEGIWSIWDRVEPVDRDTAKRILAQLGSQGRKRASGE